MIWFQDMIEGALSDRWRLEAPTIEAIQVVDAPNSTGDAVQFTLNRDDPDVNGSRRSELALRPEEANQEHWYSFSMLIPDSWETDSSWEIVTQWHGYPDFDKGETWRGPPLYILTNGDKIKIQGQWDSQEVTQDGEPEGSYELWSDELARGEWSDWVFRIKWSPFDDGSIQVWRNHELIADYQGPNTYNDESGVYFKAGIYKPDWKHNPERSVIDQRILYMDNFRFGDESMTYSDIAYYR